MKRIYTYLLVALCVVCLSYPVKAQILDEAPGDFVAPSPSMENSSSAVQTNNDSEELFNEMFSDHPISEREPDRVENFDSAVENTAQTLQESDALNTATRKRPVMEPITGDLKIGVVKGSFRVFQSYSGKTQCTFHVLLKSEINRDIKSMGVRLIYPHRAFAFVFRNVAANTSQERSITTSGNICYTFGGVPDMEVNLCRIVNTIDTECAKRLKWDNNMEAANPQE